jgi:hypothetical protein
MYPNSEEYAAGYLYVVECDAVDSVALYVPCDTIAEAREIGHARYLGGGRLAGFAGYLREPSFC